VRRASALPGVEAAGINSAVPLEGGGSEAPVLTEGQPMPTSDRPAPTCLFQAASPDYFRAMQIQVLGGRVFTEQDTESSPPVVVVDESLADRLFKDQDPVGKRIAFELQGGHSPDPSVAKPLWREVIGVVRHVKHYGLVSEPPFVQLYTPYTQLPSYMRERRPSMALVVRTAIEPEALASSLRQEVAAIDPDIPVYGLQTMREYVAQTTEQPRMSMMLLGMFGGLALMLAVVGIYGVLSYTVTERTREIGIRMALGATRADVLRLIVGQGMALTLVGVAIGVAASLGITRFLRTLLFGVSPYDLSTFVAITALLSGVALVAAFVPGRRASNVSPTEALRYE
jgi:putative ABC transport system permease protein